MNAMENFKIFTDFLQFYTAYYGHSTFLNIIKDEELSVQSDILWLCKMNYSSQLKCCHLSLLSLPELG